MGLFDRISGWSKDEKGNGKAEVTVPASSPRPKIATPEPALPVPSASLTGAATPPPAAAAPVPSAPAADGKSRDIAIYRQLMEGLYDALLIVDPSGHVIANNTRAVEYFGHDAADMWHIELRLLIPSLTPPALNKIRQNVESGRFAIVQVACTRKDGTTFDAEVAVRVMRFMSDADLIFTIRNVERRKVAQQRNLMELSVVRNAAAAMAICNTGGLLRFFNPALARMWGHDTEDQLSNVNVRDLFEDPALANALLTKPQETGTWSGRLSARHNGGFSFPVAASSSVARNAEGQIEHIVVTFIDLSSLRPASGTLRLRQPLGEATTTPSDNPSV